MQLLYCDKYVDQGTWWVISFQPEAGLHPSCSTEEVGWGAGGAQPSSPRGRKQKLPSSFPCSASPRPRMQPMQPVHCPLLWPDTLCASLHILLPVTLESGLPGDRHANRGSKQLSESPRGTWLQSGLSIAAQSRVFLVQKTSL